MDASMQWAAQRDALDLERRCGHNDRLLAKWTFVRYVVLGTFMLYRFSRLRTRARTLETNGTLGKSSPFREHPNMTSSMLGASGCNLPKWLFWACCIFIQSEGVGLAIYFGISAAMDNATIFIVGKFCYCKYVTSVSLYTLALVTFLPTAAFAFKLQNRWYEDQPWSPCRKDHCYRSKAVFILLMVFVTVLFFVIRLMLLQALGWNAVVEGLLDKLDPRMKVPVAVCVPPAVDLVQSFMLVASGASRKKGEALLDK